MLEITDTQEHKDETERVGMLKMDDSSNDLTEEQLQKMIRISEAISNGANVFLKTEYLYLLLFIFIFAIIIFFIGEHRLWTFYTTAAFIIGGLTSILSGFIGMKIATITNYRTTYSA
jgi:inorganic pyrophosphatase